MNHKPTPSDARRFGAALALIAAFALAPALQAASPLPFYETFPSTYADGVALNSNSAPNGNPKAVWDSGTGTELLVQSASALSYPNLQNTAGSKGLHFPRTIVNGTKVNLHTFTTNVTAGAVYFSCLVKINQYPSATRPFINLCAGTTSQGKGVNLFLDQNGTLGMSKFSTSVPETPSAGSNPTLALNTTYLIVGRYTFTGVASGTDDPIDVWVNPDASTFGGTAPTATMTGGTGGTLTDQTAMKSLILLSGAASTTAIDMELDEVRADTSWAAVTPPCFTAGVNSPTNQYVLPNNPATFAVTATGSSPTYQWQVSTDNGATFSNVTVGSGATTASYTTNAEAAAANNRFRCVVSVSCNSSTTNSPAALLTVCSTPVANPVTYSVTAGQTYKLLVANLLTNVSLPGGTVTLTSVANSTNSVSVTNDATRIYYTAAVTGNDSFDYVVTSTGCGLSATGTVSLVTGTVTGQATGNVTLQAGNAVLTFYGVPSASYTLQVSPDMTTWSDLTTVTAAATGLINYTDTAPPTPNAYYRLKF